MTIISLLFNNTSDTPQSVAMIDRKASLSVTQHGNSFWNLFEKSTKYHVSKLLQEFWSCCHSGSCHVSFLATPWKGLSQLETIVHNIIKKDRDMTIFTNIQKGRNLTEFEYMYNLEHLMWRMYKLTSLMCHHTPKSKNYTSTRKKVTSSWKMATISYSRLFSKYVRWGFPFNSEIEFNFSLFIPL